MSTNQKTEPILARLAATLPGISIPAGKELPEDIQWMPPGEHEIEVIHGGAPKTFRVRVDEAGARTVAEAIQARRQAAAGGGGDEPFLDFNHNDDARSAEVIEAYWGGDDARTGGIRIKVRWTEPGRQALQGRAYKRFSPGFYVDADGRVSGAPLNMGGLVNRAAFKTIAPIVSRAAAVEGPTTNSNMADEMKELADLKAAMHAKDAEIEALKAKIAANDQKAVIQAKDAEITNLKSQVESLKTHVAVQAKAGAQAVVDAAVKAGKLAPQATELHAKWVECITANPALAETLNAMPPNPALQAVLGKAADGGAASGGKDFRSLVLGKMAAGVEKAEAIRAVVAEAPEAYGAYRAANGGAI